MGAVSKKQASPGPNAGIVGISMPAAEAAYWIEEPRKIGLNRSQIVCQILRQYGVPHLERLKAASDVQGEAA